MAEQGGTGVVQTSDDKYQEVFAGSYTSFDFSQISVPPGATLTSVVLHIEHFEEEQFTTGKLQWAVGAGWPDKPTTWISVDAPVRKGKQSEATDSWDVTSFVETPEKVKSLQLQIQNSDSVSRKKTSVDCIYAVVEWGWPAPQKSSSKPQEQTGLVSYPTGGK